MLMFCQNQTAFFFTVQDNRKPRAERGQIHKTKIWGHRTKRRYDVTLLLKTGRGTGRMSASTSHRVAGALMRDGWVL